MVKQLIGAVIAGAFVLGAAGAAQAKCGDGKNRSVKIINDTSFTMRQLYGSNIGANSWQEDVLGQNVLGPGQSISVNFDDGSCYCNFDFKAVFSDDTSTIRRGYNVCTGESWRIHE